ncbi:MAG TPA: T6SS effector amidase Tae4 family protein [Polyangia bacterium]
MRKLPRFSVLKANYPDKVAFGTKALLDTIGGDVRRQFNDAINTCALRISWCLNKSDQPIVRVPNLAFASGTKAKPDPKRNKPEPAPLYLFRASEMKTYLEAQYGPGTLIYDASVAPEKVKLGGRKAVQGIIAFDWLGRFDEFGASGHVDLFFVLDQGSAASPQFVPACAGACYWQDSKKPMKAYLWETEA